MPSHRIPIYATDRAFKTYGFEGDPDCICSRCSRLIAESELALRLWPESRPEFQYRFCEACQRRMGIKTSSDAPAKPDQAKLFDGSADALDPLSGRGSNKRK